LNKSLVLLLTQATLCAYKDTRRQVVLMCRGIVPITCDELFKAIGENTNKKKASQQCINWSTLIQFKWLISAYRKEPSWDECWY